MAKFGMQGGNAQTPPIFPSMGGVFQRGNGGILPAPGTRQQLDLVQSMMQQGNASAMGSGSPLLAALAPVLGAAATTRAGSMYETAQKGRDQAAIDQIIAAMNGGSPAPAPAAAPMAAPAAQTGDPIRDGIIETANALGMNPLDLATKISYETGGTFDPTKKGPTTQWGQHRGLIQFGEPQAKQYGVDWNDPIGSQLGPNGAIANYFRDRGYKPGMGLLDSYSIVNAGGPGLYDRTDENNGGAPGSVRDKVENQMAGHRRNAERLLGGDFSVYSGAGQQAGVSPDSIRSIAALMADPNISEPIRNLAASTLSSAMQQSGGMAPRDQIRLATDMLGLEAALSGPTQQAGYRAASPEEAAQYGAQAGQFGPDGRFYPMQAGATTGDAGAMRQRNEATTIIQDAIEGMQSNGYSREEALAMIARDPIYQQQMAILGIDPSELLAAAPPPAPAQQAEPSIWQRLFGGGQQAPATPQQNPNDPLGLLGNPAPQQNPNDPLGIL